MDLARPTSLRLSREADAGRWVDIVVNGKTIRALRGESLAAALMAEGVMTMRRTPKTQSPRGVYCGMGTCFECLVKVSGQVDVRACMTRIEPGLEVETGDHGR